MTPADYIRTYYNVPARRLMRVTVDGRPGIITGFDRQYLLVRFDDEVNPRRGNGKRRGNPERCHPTWRVEYHVPVPDPVAFWAKAAEQADGCWEWQASKGGNGYGFFKLNESVHLAHRLAFQLTHGDIPEGLVIDHLCRNTLCVNPAHLEAVPQRINVLRGVSPAAQQARQTHCKRGHEFTPENTLSNGKNKRRCRTCSIAWQRQRRAEMAGGAA